MSLRVDSFPEFAVYDDTGRKICNFSRVVRDLHVVTDDAQEEYQDGKIKIAPSAVDFQLPFGGVTTANYIYIEGDKEFQVKFNGAGGTPLNIRFTSVPVGDAKSKLFLTSEATALFITNPSATDTIVMTYVVVGV